MQKTCVHCSAEFEVTKSDLEFLEEISPVFAGRKELIPPPTLCPLCRAQRRMAFRNHCHVYLRDAALPGEARFSMWTKETSFPSYENSHWFSDAWDQHASGASVDFDVPIFEQCKAVSDRSPHFALDVVNMQNSEFSNNADNSKNCYLCFNLTSSEDCTGCDNTNACRDCLDCSRITKCERCYDCVDCERCYGLQSAVSCENCSDSLFMLNCIGCKNCIGCVNLSRAQYCVFNEQKTPDEFKAILDDLQSGSKSKRDVVRAHFDRFASTLPCPHSQTRMTENSSGNYLVQCKDVDECVFIHTAERLRHCQFLFDSVHHCQDVTLFGIHAEFDYESCIVGLNARLCHFCVSVWENTTNMLYCSYCVHCSDCFGCTGLNRKQYCILNKQYTKEEYEQLMPKIIEHMRRAGEWGEFFPIADSPVPYNKSLAQWYFPMTVNEASKSGYSWYEDATPETERVTETTTLDDALPETDESIVVRSELSGKLMKITGNEIRCLREFKAPLPRTTYDERMIDRTRKMGGIRLYDGFCAKTGKPIRTTAVPNAGCLLWDREEWENSFRK